MSDHDGYRAAIALLSARLRGDVEGEQVLTGDCDCACRPLIDGLLKAAGVMLDTMATHDKVTMATHGKMTAENTADMLDKALRAMGGGGR